MSLLVSGLKSSCCSLILMPLTRQPRFSSQTFQEGRFRTDGTCSPDHTERPNQSVHLQTWSDSPLKSMMFTKLGGRIVISFSFIHLLSGTSNHLSFKQMPASQALGGWWDLSGWVLRSCFSSAPGLSPGWGASHMGLHPSPSSPVKYSFRRVELLTQQCRAMKGQNLNLSLGLWLHPAANTCWVLLLL